MSEAPKLCPCCGAPLVDDGTVRVDEDGGLVTGKGQVANLTKQEFALFLTMWSGAPRTFSKEQLLNATADYGFDEREIKIVDVFVCKARKKLKPLGIEIETVWGRGYRIVGKGQRAQAPDAGFAAPSSLQLTDSIGEPA